MRLSFVIIAFGISVSCVKESVDVRPAPEIQWIGIEEGLDLSRSTQKKILVNVYTDWCSYCQKMTDTVYPDSTVRQTAYELFLTVGLNAESEEVVQFKGESLTQRELARKFGIRSYPTMLFLDSKGELILQSNGYMPAEDFNRMLMYIGSNAYLNMEFIQFEPSQSTAKR